MPSDSFSRWVEVSRAFGVHILCSRIQENRFELWLLSDWIRIIPSRNQRTGLMTVCWVHRRVQHRTVHVNDSTAIVQIGKPYSESHDGWRWRTREICVAWVKQLLDMLAISLLMRQTNCACSWLWVRVDCGLFIRGASPLNGCLYDLLLYLHCRSR